MTVHGYVALRFFLTGAGLDRSQVLGISRAFVPTLAATDVGRRASRQ
jgi:hypothetical protein